MVETIVKEVKEGIDHQPSGSKARTVNFSDLKKLLRNVMIWAIPSIIMNLQTVADGGDITIEKFGVGVGISICIEFLRRYASNSSQG